MKLLPVVVCLIVGTSTLAQPLITPFEHGKGKQTSTYKEGLEFYRKLDAQFKKAVLITAGLTDSGHPIHLMVLSKEGLRSPKKIGKRHVILIVNAIHPGESDGVDASMMLARDLLMFPEDHSIWDSVVVAIIPFYNIGGALNRGCCTRANQNGPEEYGFRGNARNYDLNRDFIKADTRNTEAFQSIFHTWKPSLLLDTHVSNGADYSYTITYIATMRQKLGMQLGSMFYEAFIPVLSKQMVQKGWEMTPYVDFDDIPENGMRAFFDSPRFSTGYAAMFHCPGIMIETHMLKPYSERVTATYTFLLEAVQVLAKQATPYRQAIEQEKWTTLQSPSWVTQWQLDASISSQIPFKGYSALYEPSVFTSNLRLRYDRDNPYSKQLPYKNQYVALDTVNIPIAYLIPAGWHTVIRELNRQGIELFTVADTVSVPVEGYTIQAYQTVKSPYEGHYLHYNTRVLSDTMMQVLHPGDVVVFTRQQGRRYICETLEPASKDSFFNWNFFDSVLQPKEGFSDYVFEDVAAALIQSDTSLALMLKHKMKEDTIFAKQQSAILQFIYQNSHYAEKSYLRYPVSRMHTLPLFSLSPHNSR